MTYIGAILTGDGIVMASDSAREITTVDNERRIFHSYPKVFVGGHDFLVACAGDVSVITSTVDAIRAKDFDSLSPAIRLIQERTRKWAPYRPPSTCPTFILGGLNDCGDLELCMIDTAKMRGRRKLLRDARTTTIGDWMFDTPMEGAAEVPFYVWDANNNGVPIDIDSARDAVPILFQSCQLASRAGTVNTTTQWGFVSPLGRVSRLVPASTLVVDYHEREYRGELSKREMRNAHQVVDQIHDEVMDEVFGVVPISAAKRIAYGKALNGVYHAFEGTLSDIELLWKQRDDMQRDYGEHPTRWQRAKLRSVGRLMGEYKSLAEKFVTAVMNGDSRALVRARRDYSERQKVFENYALR